ncbi:MAG: phasin family protein [Moraxellaceae bacterium]|nr:phasin family protein [Moraxellaceae bacterium]
MGELKQVSEQQQGLVERVKSLGEQVYLANLGLVAKAEEEGKKQYERLIAVGTEARAEKAAETPKPLLVVAGLVQVLIDEADKLTAEHIKQQVESVKLKLTGLKVVEESQKLFGELVAAGEKRKAA